MNAASLGSSTEPIEVFSHGAIVNVDLSIHRLMALAILQSTEPKRRVSQVIESGLKRPLDERRTGLNIVPVTEGHWSWHSRPYLRDAIAPSLASETRPLVSI